MWLGGSRGCTKTRGCSLEITRLDTIQGSPPFKRNEPPRASGTLSSTTLLFSKFEAWAPAIESGSACELRLPRERYKICSHLLSSFPSCGWPFLMPAEIASVEAGRDSLYTGRRASGSHHPAAALSAMEHGARNNLVAETSTDRIYCHRAHYEGRTNGSQQQSNLPNILSEAQHAVTSAHTHPSDPAMSSDIVQRLREHLDQNPKVRADFEKSLKEALAYNVPEFEEWGIETLDDYLNYYESFLKWVPTENKDGKYVLKHICIFYFVLDLFPMAKHQGEISPITTPPYTFLSQWIIDYAKAMGTFMDSPESISEESIDTFYQAESYHMWDYERVPWRTFNEFFARKIKPEVRPIDSPNDNKIIVSAADAKFDGAWPVNGNSLVHLKGMPWSIRQLLDDAKGSYQSTFAGGVFCHSFLGPNDYHRQHAPVSGEVLEARVIEGLCYLEVEPKHDNNLVDGHRHLHMHRRMEDVVYTDSESGALQGAAGVANNPGYQFIQARGLILIQTADIGLVAVLPIGMAQVSSVVLSVKKGDRVKKGDELAYFQLGGSDVVMVFEEQANVKFTANHHDEQHGRHGWYPFGRQIAVASPST